MSSEELITSQSGGGDFGIEKKNVLCSNPGSASDKKIRAGIEPHGLISKLDNPKVLNRVINRFGI